MGFRHVWVSGVLLCLLLPVSAARAEPVSASIAAYLAWKAALATAAAAKAAAAAAAAKAAAAAAAKAAAAGGAAKGVTTAGAIGGAGVGAATTGMLSPDKLAGIFGGTGSAAVSRQFGTIAISPAMRQTFVEQAKRVGSVQVTQLPMTPPSHAVGSLPTGSAVPSAVRPEATFDLVFRYSNYGITTYEVLKILHTMGLGSSGSKEIDVVVHKEIATAALSGQKAYFIKVCKGSDGEYAVPSDTLKCLNDTQPWVLESSLDFSKLRD